MNPDSSFRGSVVLFGVEREAKPFLGSFHERPQRLGSQRWLCGDRDVLTIVIGVGKTEAQNKVEALLAEGCRPRQIIVSGFAGALRANLQVGEVIVASEVVDESGNHWATSWPAERSGRVLTSAQMIGEPDQKRMLGEKHQADVVDMESSAVAEVCQRHGIPFGCVRVVSDDVTKPLSQRLMTLVESGRVSLWRLLQLVLRSPKMGVELVRLARQTRFAADRLTERLRLALAAG